MKLLLTGFEPFGGESVNPAMLVLKELKKEEERLAAELVTAVLPVEFGCMRDQTDRLLSSVRPDAVICLGQAGGRAQITPERIAVNLADAGIADNAGAMPCEEPLRPDGPAAYFSTLPNRQIIRAMDCAGIPSVISNTAGLYVCNCLMYHLLDLLAVRKLSIPAGFIHIPYLPEQVCEKPDTPCMPLAVTAEGIRIAVCETIRAAEHEDPAFKAHERVRV